MNLTDSQRLGAETRSLVAAFPDLHTLASTLASDIIKQHTGHSLDPELVYWHRFDRAASSPRTFTGWEHWGRPVESLTLLELVYQRFAVRDQDSLDNLQVMGGFYLADPNRGRYDETNEVRLLASDVSSEFWKRDFSALYHRQLKQFWVTHGETFVLVARATFVNEAAKARQQGWLNDADLLTLQQGLVARLKPPVSLAGLAVTAPAEQPVQVHELKVGDFVARDVVRVVSREGRQILYLPGDRQSLRAFADEQALRHWLRDAATGPDSDSLMRHFSAFNLLRTPSLETLRSALKRVGDAPLPATVALTGDCFVYLRERAKAEMTRQADTLLTSNESLRERLWIGYLGAFVSLGSTAAPLAWPIALMVMGASITNVVLNAKQAVHARDTKQRRAAILNAILSGVNALFNAPFVFAGLAERPVGDLDALPAPETDDLVAGERDPVAGEQELPLITQPLPLPAVPEGGYWNSLGMIERSDMLYLYRVRALSRGEDPQLPLREGFAATRRFECAKPMLEGRALMTFATARGAVHYAQAAFDGPYVLYEIDAQGLPCVSLRENVQHNLTFTLERQGYPADFAERRLAEGRSLSDFANDGWLYDEVHVQADAVDADRISLIPAAELEPLAEALQPWHPYLGKEGVLRGVKVRKPGPSRPVTQYSIDAAGYPHNVRYDPLSASWRAQDGRAWRFHPGTERFVRLPAPDAQPHPSSTQMQQALQELGIKVTFPLELEPVSPAAELPLPRRIHSIWIGRHMPRRFVQRVLDNAELASRGSDPFETHLYLSIQDPVEWSRTLDRLGAHPAWLKVHRLEDTEFFKALRSSPFYPQYRAASAGPAANYASAVDVLRYRLLYREGGFYLDVDDSIQAAEAGEPGFADRPWLAREGELMLNALVRHHRLGMVLDFNNSNFASLPGNPLLERISQESLQRFQASGDLYLTRPYEYSDTQADLEQYGKRISRVTGPGLVNEVLDEQSPALRQYRGLCRLAQDEIYLLPGELQSLRARLRAQYSQYSPLAGLIRIGTTGSWMRTR